MTGEKHGLLSFPGRAAKPHEARRWQRSLQSVLLSRGLCSHGGVTPGSFVVWLNFKNQPEYRGSSIFSRSCTKLAYGWTRLRYTLPRKVGEGRACKGRWAGVTGWGGQRQQRAPAQDAPRETLTERTRTERARGIPARPGGGG